MHSAIAVFPFDHNTRRLPIMLTVEIQYVMTAEDVLAQVDRAREQDPHAQDLKRQRATLLTFLSEQRK